MPRKQNKNRQRKTLATKPRTIESLSLRMPLHFGFPPQMLTRLRYCETYPLTSTSGSIGKQVMNLNSTFDPDQSGVGHQPLYRDTYAAIYDQYAVVSAKITASFVVNSTQACICGVVIDDDATTATSASTLMEQNLGIHQLVSQATGSPNSWTVSMEWDCKKHLGVDPFASLTYKTQVGGNPTELVNCLLWAVPADQLATTVTWVNVTLEQTVLWTELQTPTAS